MSCQWTEHTVTDYQSEPVDLSNTEIKSQYHPHKLRYSLAYSQCNNQWEKHKCSAAADLSNVCTNRLWARRGFPPQGEFSTLFFSETPMSPEHFYFSAIWRLGRFWVIEVNGHQVHFWMWSISWLAINDYLVNLSQCVSRKWSQMV